MFSSIKLTYNYIITHPLTRKNKYSAFLRVIKWQIRSRISKRTFIYPFVENSKLMVHGGMAGATGNIYAGLHEFEDMMFLLHLLRQDDLFADIGANIGSYTILASAVIGANSIAFEPVPSTFRNLKNNISVNNIEARVELNNSGVGEQKDNLRFTSGHDTTNHVVSSVEKKLPDDIEVDIVKLDDVLSNRRPVLVKIDTEGFELSVLKGAIEMLKANTTLAMIVELNGACHRYGVNEKEIHEFILGYNFIPVSYEPFERKLKKLGSFNSEGNTIYIRDENKVSNRLETSRKFKVLNQCV